MHRLAYSADAASAAPSTEPLLTEKLIAISHVKRAAEEGVTRAALVDMAEAIDRDVRKFNELIGGPSARLQAEPMRVAVRFS